MLVWPGPLNPGNYDIVIDVNRNDVYDLGVDILDGSPDGSVPGFTVEEPPRKKWTFMVYLDGDGDLERAGVADVNEMEQAGSNNDINIIVQFDRIPGHDSSNDDWTGTRRYYVTRDTSTDGLIRSTLVQDLGEVNMANSNTFRDFVNWAIAKYPADRYALVLWDHGSGVRTRQRHEATRDVVWDDTNGGSLSIAEVRHFLEHIGANLDVLGFDTCLMGMVEVAYEMRNIAPFSVFSQDLEPGAGWPYHTILNALRGNPNMTAAQLASRIVTDFGASYPPAETGVTHSAAESAQVSALAGSIDQFAQAMIDDIDTQRTELQNLVGQAQRFDNNPDPPDFPDYRDLRHFAELVNANIADGEIQAAAQAVMNAVTGAIGGRETHSADLPNAHGLSIWLPDKAYYTDHIGKYGESLFAHDTRWDEFLDYLWREVPRIAFTSRRDGNEEIYLMNSDGSNQTRLTNNPAHDVLPSWSPDGSKIAFTSNRDGNKEIYVMNSDGINQTNLTNNPAWDWWPSWSPDGSKIAFSTSRDLTDGGVYYGQHIYVMNSDGANVTRLGPYGATFESNPCWSPDGSKIAFVSLYGNWDIYVMNSDGSNWTRLTNNPEEDRFPSWSPDGSKIAFDSNRDGDRQEIYVMNSDGSNQTRLPNPALGTDPSWSPF